MEVGDIKRYEIGQKLGKAEVKLKDFTSLRIAVYQFNRRHGTDIRTRSMRGDLYVKRFA